MKHYIVSLCAIGLLVLAAGCGHKDDKTTSAVAPDTQAQIKAIQNNSHIPAQMKAGIIQRIQHGQKTGVPGSAKK